MKELTHGGLFEGIGGFSIGAELSNIKTKWVVENNPFKQQILSQHFKEVKIYGKIQHSKKLPFVHIITGGFPCQDISVSGKGTGIVGARSGMWSEFARVISETKPFFVIIENSPNLLNKGFEFVLYDLYKLGYDAQWRCLSAEQFGYRHLRKRLFVIAYTHQIGRAQREVNIFKSIQEVIQQEKVSKQTDLPMLLKFFNRHSDKRSFSYNHGFSKGLDANTIESAGDAVCPLITEYLFKCIKIFYNESRKNHK